MTCRKKEALFISPLPFVSFSPPLLGTVSSLNQKLVGLRGSREYQGTQPALQFTCIMWVFALVSIHPRFFYTFFFLPSAMYAYVV